MSGAGKSAGQAPLKYGQRKQCVPTLRGNVHVGLRLEKLLRDLKGAIHGLRLQVDVDSYIRAQKV